MRPSSRKMRLFWTGAAGIAVLLCASESMARMTSRESCQGRPVKGDKPWTDARLSPTCRADLLLESFKSIDEKLDVLANPGRSSTWLETRGLPKLSGADGPAGIRGLLGVTAFPSPLGVAASFSAETASAYGHLLGAEFVDAGLNRMGGPALDIARTWNFGRTTESFGEDPFLSARMAAAEVKAIQSHHVLAMVKHFAVYTQEQGRAGDHPLRLKPAANMIVSDRAMREIYLPAFEAAVKEGGAGQIMCSFPRINGIYACEHPKLLGVLKGEWGFDGMVVPDFPDAQRSIIAAINAGLDSGMFVGVANPLSTAPGNALATATDNSFNGENIRTAVKTRKISAARIDDLIRRRVLSEFRIGTFDNPAKRKADDVSTTARRAAAADIVSAGAVLLKNKNDILPLGADIRSIALIGTQAGENPTVVEMGSAYVTPTHVEPVLTAMRGRAPASTTVVYAPGTSGLSRLPLAPPSLFRTDAGEGGLRADYVANANLDFSAKPFLSRLEEGVNHEALSTDPIFPANKLWSVRWRGLFMPTETGIQKFTLAGSGTAELRIGGKLIGRYANTDFGDIIFANIPMVAGKGVPVDVRWTPRVTFRAAAVDAYGTTLGPVVRLGWSRPDNLLERAVETARGADVAIVFVGHRVGEGMDRQSLALPGDQDALIEAVAKANPRTVVVLQTGGAVTMPWLDQVAGVLEMWLPGDTIGSAAAKLLYGDHEPAGRLPVTFPGTETQGPARMPKQYPGTLHPETGALDDTHFDEDLLIGYRFWDARNQEPLFPFGYGLSYTQVQMSGLDVNKMADGGANVRVALRNVGKRDGAEVVQVYVGFPTSAGAPPKQLKAISKVHLKAGEARTVEVPLDSRAFQYWNEGRGGWQRDGGPYKIMVGRSSRDIVYSAELMLDKN